MCKILLLSICVAAASFCNCFAQENVRSEANKLGLIEFTISSSIPKTGISRSLYPSTMAALLDFLGRSKRSFLALTNREIDVLKANSPFDDVGESEQRVDLILSMLDAKTQVRLEAIATSIDGLDRIFERSKFNQLTLSEDSRRQVENLKKKYRVERFGPLASAGFAGDPTDEDRVAMAVGEVKSKMSLGFEIAKILNSSETSSIIEFVRLSALETELRDHLVKARYTMTNGFASTP